MPSIDIVVRSDPTRTSRVKQLEGAFDVPAQEKLEHEWHGEVPFDERDWNVGLIVGPSGSGKSCIVNQLFGPGPIFGWSAGSVVDDFAQGLSIETITAACSAVGFNTIPSWMKPYNVLSNGERFRVDLARRLVEVSGPIVVDEFTSVVDRQVAKIAAHAVQKHIRKVKKRFVAATCHYDVIEWLQPDWILEPATMSFTWRELRRRPPVECHIARVPYAAWQLFAPYHYLTRTMHRACHCYGMYVEGVLASFASVLHRPHPKTRSTYGVSRAVTLPDYQGLGLIFALMDTLGAAYKTLGRKLNIYPAHPSFIRSADRNPVWLLVKKPGSFEAEHGKSGDRILRRMGGRPSATFTYCGPIMDKQIALDLIQS